ncbi:hypothetical protein HNV10_01645 [Winogradskyella litoriviva]|uniref:Uncharacterized protein n=1 Tax=Winogradskyella litoriviva TaxID=1220182 RepID=A0ABX2E0V5_9FLAO|nr:hypothetical protein [Winogradskyella litoriviva]NRD21925.1 hypothetical protein [Winogradskyella litoriviva]
MGKLVAFSYSFLILIQSFNFNLEDFSKINTLIEHAQYHKEKYGDTFFEFLAEHYGDNKDDHENEHEEHKDLPFKDAQHMLSHTNTSFISVDNHFDFQYSIFVEIPFNFHYEETFTSFENSSFFHPPKHT